ncbi:hypothetical protein JVT61DRAFT_3896 [Boletus reticuloceps]|uniref:ATP-dependent DNA helicase n=1 Tax=Boletus reticuloceps TaxID=495285 RepID=A0A8I3A7G9_9AGAM|nr:hypothetical protein JVT61DRAFT_3896 [Boletus reticuloceps]
MSICCGLLSSGSTLHSWAGLTGTKETVAEALKRIKSSSQATLRWIETKVLVSDEISMLGADDFNLLEAVTCEICGNNVLFGGLQVSPVRTQRSASLCFLAHLVWRFPPATPSNVW